MPVNPDRRGIFETFLDDLKGTSQKEIDEKNEEYRQDENRRDAQNDMGMNSLD